MSTLDPVQQLVTNLRSPGRRNRTGIWLMPVDLLGDEANVAVKLTVGVVDLRRELLNTLPAQAQFAPLSSDRLLQLVDQIANQRDRGTCLLIHNLDLLLARLTHQQRNDFWRFVYQGLPYRPCALLFVMPATAHSLMPASDLLPYWTQAGRLVLPM